MKQRGKAMNSTAVAEPATNQHAQGPFDPKINNWAEGTLMSIDADGAKLSIRGAKRPYASEYAKMLRNIHETTAKMTQAERKLKSFEIRQNWNSALIKAQEQMTDMDSDFTFHLPGKGHQFVVVDETMFYSRLTPSTGSTSSLTDTECASVHALKDLKIGECVVVGYESGMFTNSAYAVIKANKSTAK